MASENLKKIILIFAQGAAQSEKSFADGFQLRDIFDFYPQIAQIPSINWNSIAAEVKSRTEDTNKDVLDYLKESLKLENAWLENLIEKAFAAIVAVDDFIASLKKPAPVPPPVS